MEQSDKTKRFIDWRQNDKGDTVAWALILIWGALVMLGGTLDFGDQYSWWNPWGLFFIGIGVIGIGGSLIRFLIGSLPKPSMWDFIFGLFFLFMGLGNKTGWIWAIALLVVGFSILRSTYQRKQS